jgi:hypothetical protein
MSLRAQREAESLLLIKGKFWPGGDDALSTPCSLSSNTTLKLAQVATEDDSQLGGCFKTSKQHLEGFVLTGEALLVSCPHSLQSLHSMLQIRDVPKSALRMAVPSEQVPHLPSRRNPGALIYTRGKETSSLTGRTYRTSAVASCFAVPTISASYLNLPTLRS